MSPYFTEKEPNTVEAKKVHPASVLNSKKWQEFTGGLPRVTVVENNPIGVLPMSKDIEFPCLDDFSFPSEPQTVFPKCQQLFCAQILMCAGAATRCLRVMYPS